LSLEIDAEGPQTERCLEEAEAPDSVLHPKAYPQKFLSPKGWQCLTGRFHDGSSDRKSGDGSLVIVLSPLSVNEVFAIGEAS
jgi:hypothetical protein